MSHGADCSVWKSKPANHKGWCDSLYRAREDFDPARCQCWECGCQGSPCSDEDTLCAFAAAGMVACGRCGLVMKPLPAWTGVEGKLCSDCGAEINVPSRAAIEAWAKKRDERKT